MATVTGSAGTETARLQTKAYPVGSVRFDWVAAALSAWVVGGLYLDGWAHRHGQVDNTFFTPWHALLYSGVLAIAIFLFVNQWRNMDKGYRWRRALPAGYMLSLVGAGLFILGGGIDFVWHSLFGFEVNLEALLSPAHLLLATSGSLMITGPLRSAFVRLKAGGAYGWREIGPLLVSLPLVLSVLTFFTSFVHPVSEPYAAQHSSQWYYPQSVGIASFLLQSGFLMGIVLLAVKHWRLPLGAMTLIVGLNGALMTIAPDTYYLIPAVVLAGALADVLLWLLKPSATHPARFYLFGFLTPVAIYGAYFLGLQLTQGIEWTIHLWLGAIFMAGIVGLFVSFLLLSPFQGIENMTEADGGT